VELSTFPLTSERSPEADIRPRRFNVADVPEADVQAAAPLVKVEMGHGAEVPIGAAMRRLGGRLPDREVRDAQMQGMSPPIVCNQSLSTRRAL
jgi:hypothetical protein